MTAQEGRQVRPAGQPRDPGEGHQVRVRAFVHEERPAPYTTYFNFIEGAPEGAQAKLQDIPGIVVDRADPYKITFKLSEAAGRRLRGVPDHADHHAGPEGVRGEVRQGEPVDVQRERRRQRSRTWSPTTPRASSPATRPASRSSSFATRTGTRARTSVPPTSTRSCCARTRPTPTSPAARCSQGENLVLDTNPPAQVLKRVVQRQKDQLVDAPGRRLPLVPAEHDDQAAGRPQRPQGDPRGVRPRRGPQGARRRVRRSDRDALHPAGHRGLRGGRRREGPGRRLPGQPERATWPWPRST